MASPKPSTLAHQQLTDLLHKYPSPTEAAPPRKGWIRALREALGMTQAQLGERIDVSPQAIREFENSEAQRRITLGSLDRVARGMGCRVVYALVPEEGSLEAIRRQRADQVAESMLATAGHSMSLEAQGVAEPVAERQKQYLVESLLQGSPRKLWR